MFKEKVFQIQLLKSQGIDTIQYEKEIDQILFDLYNLTTEEKEEIGFIEIQ